MASRDYPLNPQNLFEVLKAGVSQSTSHIQLATSQLKLWETSPGFWSLLQEAYLDKSLPSDVRKLSIITLKYGVERFWRKTAQNAIKKDEKERIRARLLEAVDEEDERLALQNAVIVGKVGRNEYPLEWPDLFTKLLDLVRSSTPPANAPPSFSTAIDPDLRRLKRSLGILLHVVKELCSGRLPKIRSALHNATPELFSVLSAIYTRFVDQWVGRLHSDDRNPVFIHDQLVISLSCLKILRRLVVNGFEFANRSEDVKQFWLLLNKQWPQFFGFAQQAEAILPPDTYILLIKHITNFGKLYNDLAKAQPAAFGLMPNILEMLQNYWQVIEAYGETMTSGSRQSLSKRFSQKRRSKSNGEESEDTLDETTGVGPLAEKAALQGMQIYRSCLKMVHNPTQTFKYRQKEEKTESEASTNFLKAQVFSTALVVRMTEVLVTKYFILRQSDLEAWEEDPENWALQWDDQSESWEYLIRPCAEKLFMDIAINYKENVAKPLYDVFLSMSSVASNDILIKDSVYTAVGLAANILFHVLDFDSFLLNTLVQEIQVSQPGYSILRRRIAILISQWVTIKITVANRPTLYQITQHLMNKEDRLNDLVVRLTAARCLKSSIDEWDCKIEDFMPFAPDLIEKIMALIDEVEETETKMSLLYVIEIIIVRLDHHVAPYADRIVQILPPLWEKTGDQHLFKQAILSVLSKLVTAMKDSALAYQDMIVSLIKYAVDPANGLASYLLDDALELWDAVIQVTPSTASTDLLSLFPYILPCLEIDSHSILIPSELLDFADFSALKSVLDIIEGYVLLAPQEMLSNYAAAIFQGFAQLLHKDLKSEPNNIIVFTVEMIIRSAGSLGDPSVQIVGKALVESGFVIKIFEGVYGTWQAHQTSGPNKRYPPVETIILTDYFQVLSRLIITSTPIFMEIVNHIGSLDVGGDIPSLVDKTGADRVMKWLLEEWFSHVCFRSESLQRTTLTYMEFENIGHPRSRKLNCLALTKLLEVNQDFILFKLQDLMTMWTDVVSELNDANGDSLVYADVEDSGGVKSAAELRRNDLLATDPVHTINTVEFIKHYLALAQAQNGGPEQFQNTWAVNIDKEVLGAFVQLGIF